MNPSPAVPEPMAPLFQAGAFEVGEGKPMPNEPHFLYKVTNADSSGRFVLLQGGLGPRMLIPPHVHEREDEMTIVIKGRLGARVGDTEYEIGPGGVLFKPRGILHAMWNPTDEPQILLEYISPGAYATFFEEVAASGGFMHGSQTVERLAAKYGQRWIVDAPWLPEVIERCRLQA